MQSVPRLHNLKMRCSQEECLAGTCDINVCISSLFHVDDFAHYNRELKLRHPELILIRKRYLASLSKQTRRKHVYPSKGNDVFNKYCTGMYTDADISKLPKCVRMEFKKISDPLDVFK